MILCALPFPPVPVQAARFEDGNLLGAAQVVSSHDIISHLLEAACLFKDAKANAERRRRQTEVLRCLMMDLVKDGIVGGERLYRLYCTHTAAHIGCFYPAGSPPELRFLPFDYVCKGDPVHRAMCAYMAAQSILLGTKSTVSEWTPFGFPELLAAARDRLVTEAPGPAEGTPAYSPTADREAAGLSPSGDHALGQAAAGPPRESSYEGDRSESSPAIGQTAVEGLPCDPATGEGPACDPAAVEGPACDPAAVEGPACDPAA